MRIVENPTGPPSSTGRDRKPHDPQTVRVAISTTDARYCAGSAPRRMRAGALGSRYVRPSKIRRQVPPEGPCTSHERAKIEHCGAHFIVDTMEQVRVVPEGDRLKFVISQKA